MRDGTKIKAFFVAGVFALWLAGCRGAAPAGPAVNPEPRAAAGGPAGMTSAPALRRIAQFDHRRAEHQRLQCSQCHRRDDRRPALAAPERPYHDACAGCHAQEDFLRTSAPAPLCRVCHGQEPVMGEAEQVALAAFPEQLRQFGLKPFSHQRHLDPKRLPAGAPALKCDRCHRFEGRPHAAEDAASFPRHAECYSCHVHTAGQKLGDCGDCHTNTAAAMQFEHGPSAPGNLYNFSHAAHFRQARIRSDCALCHQPVTPSGEAQSDIVRPRTPRGQRHQSACWKCHAQAREPVCTKCHRDGTPL